MTDPCTFCEIVAGRLPSIKDHEEEGILVFRNRREDLPGWFPVQLLIAPTECMTQEELWKSGDLLGRMGRLAVRFGNELCPDGYRVISNFGRDSGQSQPHAHLHVIGGEFLAASDPPSPSPPAS